MKKILLYTVAFVIIINALIIISPVLAADETAVPVQPKIIRVVKNAKPLAPEFSGPNITMMATDPVVSNQIKKTSELINKNSVGKNKNVKIKAAPVSQPLVETIKLPISDVSTVVKNTGDKFLFVDITKRDDKQKPLNRIVLSPEIRRLQIEAVRQSAAKRK